MNFKPLDRTVEERVWRFYKGSTLPFAALKKPEQLRLETAEIVRYRKETLMGKPTEEIIMETGEDGVEICIKGWPKVRKDYFWKLGYEHFFRGRFMRQLEI